MSTPRKFAIVVLLACASTGVALPLYQEVIGLPAGGAVVTLWAGWPQSEAQPVPAFWLLPLTAMTASIFTIKNRPKPARALVLALLTLQIGFLFIGKYVLRSEASWTSKIAMIDFVPGPAFYPVGAVLLAAFLLLATTGSSSPPPGRP